MSKKRSKRGSDSSGAGIPGTPSTIGSGSSSSLDVNKLAEKNSTSSLLKWYMQNKMKDEDLDKQVENISNSPTSSYNPSAFILSDDNMSEKRSYQNSSYLDRKEILSEDRSMSKEPQDMSIKSIHKTFYSSSLQPGDDFENKSKIEKDHDIKTLNTNQIETEEKDFKITTKVGRPSFDSTKIDKPLLDSIIVDKPLFDSTKVSRPSFDSTKVKKPLIDSTKVSKPSFDSTKIDKPLLDSIIVDKPLFDSNKVSRPSFDSTKIDKPLLDSIIVDKPLFDSTKVSRPSFDSTKVKKPLIDSNKVDKHSFDSTKVEKSLIDNIKTKEGKHQIDYELNDATIQHIDSTVDNKHSNKSLTENKSAKRKIIDVPADAIVLKTIVESEVMDIPKKPEADELEYKVHDDISPIIQNVELKDDRVPSSTYDQPGGFSDFNKYELSRATDDNSKIESSNNIATYPSNSEYRNKEEKAKPSEDTAVDIKKQLFESDKHEENNMKIKNIHKAEENRVIEEEQPNRQNTRRETLCAISPNPKRMESISSKGAKSLVRYSVVYVEDMKDKDKTEKKTSKGMAVHKTIGIFIIILLICLTAYVIIRYTNKNIKPGRIGLTTANITNGTNFDVNPFNNASFLFN